MSRIVRLGATPHLLVAALCAGIAVANLARVGHLLAVGAVASAAGLLGAACPGEARILGLAVGLVLAGWGWGSARLDALDQSPLLSEVGRAERALVVVTGPTKLATFELRAPGEVLRWHRTKLREPVQLELPRGRPPPQGARLEVLAEVALPRGPSHGFDERRYLRRRGIHVVLRVDRWHLVGRRGGLGAVADRIRSSIEAALRSGTRGERRALLVGVVLGDDSGLSRRLRDRFRASGLYHLLAVSGQNVALLAGGALALAWLLGVSRWIGELAAIAGIAGYVLAVGAQPSIVRAGIAGALGSLAWLTARQRDRWYFMLLGALALLAWNPYAFLDAGFELSFGAVVAIFTLAPWLRRRLEGYPVPSGLAEVLAVTSACSVATAPIVWLQFRALPLLAVPANVLAAPAMIPLLGLAFLAAAMHPLSPGAAVLPAALAGWCASYLAWCAKLFGGLPFAQINGAPAACLLLAGAAVAAAYAWRRCRMS